MANSYSSTLTSRSRCGSIPIALSNISSVLNGAGMIIFTCRSSLVLSIAQATLSSTPWTGANHLPLNSFVDGSNSKKCSLRLQMSSLAYHPSSLSMSNHPPALLSCNMPPTSMISATDTSPELSRDVGQPKNSCLHGAPGSLARSRCFLIPQTVDRGGYEPCTTPRSQIPGSTVLPSPASCAPSKNVNVAA